MLRTNDSFIIKKRVVLRIESTKIRANIKKNIGFIEKSPAVRPHGFEELDS